MQQLPLFAPAPVTIAPDPLGEPVYRFRRFGLWWDGNRWGDERRALQVVGDNLLAVEMVTVGAAVEVVKTEGKK